MIEYVTLAPMPELPTYRVVEMEGERHNPQPRPAPSARYVYRPAGAPPIPDKLVADAMLDMAPALFLID